MSQPRNLILPDPDTLNQVEYGKFVLANLAAKRAKQIKEGAPPLVRIESNHPLSIALAEIAEGKIRPLLDGAAPAVEDALDIPTLDLGDEDFLLPSLEDEDDEDGLTLSDLEDEDDEEDDDDDDDSEEVAESDDEEDTTDSEDDGTISLDDLAEQEEDGDDEDDDN